MKNLFIYVHIPFCERKCAYCGFLSFRPSEERISAYKTALISQISCFQCFPWYKIKTVYFGGGTPSYMPAEYLTEILDAIRRAADVSADAEITLEANPESVSFEYLRELTKAGFNRISIGAQSFVDNELKALGRLHSGEKAVKAVEDARLAGFGNIGIDLMFSLPGQTVGSLCKSLDIAAGLGITHISCYGLTVEEGTRLHAAGYTVSEELDREMCHRNTETLKKAGFVHYEISNFCREGMESRHNTAYWTGEEYLGLGLGAHSFVDKTRYYGETDFNEYLLNPNKKHVAQVLSEKDEMAEFFVLGLRLLKGIDGENFSKKFDKNIYEVYGREIAELVEAGLLRKNGHRLSLTKKGIDLSNQVFLRFI